MKKVAILFMLIVVTICVNAQTRQQIKAEKKIRIELSQLYAQLRVVNSRISGLASDTAKIFEQKQRLNAAINGGAITGEQEFAYKNQLGKIETVLRSARTKTNSSHYQGLKTEEMRLQFRITELQLNLRDFTDKTVKQAYKDEIPRELTVTEEKRRKRGNNIRREELGYKKLEATTVNADPVQGYLGLIWNQTRYTPALFVIKDASGRDVDKGTFFLQPGESVEAYLLPGQYIGVVKVHGQISGSSMIKSEPSQKYIDAGKGKNQYHWFLTKTRDGI
ncbi:MAG: hypothetical protein Q8Q67_00885 [bacterium]|nr:hypothetical protein [bacterium]